MRMHYDPHNPRSYIGFVLPADQLAALDQARTKLRLSRSQFLRQAVTAYLGQQRQPTAK
ncbi:metal-responsive CopG/Arc/MetJ family transcriptional regulator [Bradyrhizobium ottawaense]|uniref:ribbon-helix-helix domain-containing protein n=1 Tax=Bradyrhizobium ottawaense TaxID=931866 RepID=UPI003517ABF1